MAQPSAPGRDLLAGEGPQRLLLVELANTDRYSQYRAELFPFLFGHARERGLAVRWIRFGFRPEDQPDNPYVVRLTEPEMERLLAACDLFEPTHALFNERLHPPQVEGLRGRRSAMALAFVADRPDLPPRIDGWHRWLGLPPGARGATVDRAPPAYRAEPFNALAEEIDPLIRVVAGPICRYARPLRRNPWYADLDLDRAIHRAGCAFCGSPAERATRLATPALDLALRQVEAARRDLPELERLDVLIESAGVFRRLDPFLAGVLDRDLAPCTLMFSCRVDELLEAAPALDRRLPELGARGHAVWIENIGVENFSEPENARLNKGISLAQVRAVLGHLRRWERAHPRTFAFFEPGGFGFITFTPWTTLGDLEVNLASMRELDLPLTPLFLCSRLILLPGRPIVELTRRQGLLAPAFDDRAVAAMVGGGCLTSPDDREIPWRFADARVAALYSLLIRLFSPDCPEDELRDRARSALRPGAPGGASVDELVEALIRAARALDHPSPGAILSRIEPRASGRRRPGVSPTGWPESPIGGTGESVTERRELRLLARALGGLSRRSPEALAGYEATALRWCRHGEARALEVTFERGPDRLAFLIAPAGVYPDPAARTRGRCLVFRRDTPVDSPDKRLTLATLARVVGRLFD